MRKYFHILGIIVFTLLGMIGCAPSQSKNESIPERPTSEHSREMLSLENIDAGERNIYEKLRETLEQPDKRSEIPPDTSPDIKFKPENNEFANEKILLDNKLTDDTEQFPEEKVITEISSSPEEKVQPSPEEKVQPEKKFLPEGDKEYLKEKDNPEILLPESQPTPEKVVDQGCQPTTEKCDGIDNDCDGKVDEGLTKPCYEGPTGTQGKGICKGGQRVCVKGHWSACLGQVTPKAESCGIDNNCDGKVDCHEHSKDIAALLAGVTTIAAPGIPGALTVFGRNAFPVATGVPDNGILDVVAAAAKWGKGRVVIFSHSGYLSVNDLRKNTTGRLLRNAIDWTAASKVHPPAKPRVALLSNQLLSYLQSFGYKRDLLSPSTWLSKLNNYDVLIAKSDYLQSTTARKAVIDFISKGGGLIMAETGWGWAMVHPDKKIATDFPANILTSRFGLAWTAAWIKDSSSGYDNTKAPDKLLHAQNALDLLEKHAQGNLQPSSQELSQAVHTVSRAIPYLPDNDSHLLPRLKALLKTYGSQIIPTSSHPLRRKDGLKRVLFAFQLNSLKKKKPTEVKAHPAAKYFPGSVPSSAQRVTRSITLNTKIPDWHSTGLYAAPGEVITVTIPSSAIHKKLKVRIGAHKDTLWHKDQWDRAPEITRTWLLSKTTTQVANAFGGMIYIVVPKHIGSSQISVKIANAVQAPFYILGKTNLTDWKQTIRSYPAPWAELASDKMILTVPSTVIRGLDAPDTLMKHWNKVLDACADLAAIPHLRPRPERIVMDKQISAGYMHAGYPIMTYLDVRYKLTNPNYMMKYGGWGIYHEIGHNHQSPYWTFDGTVEVTVNLFTLYVFNQVHNKPKPRSELYGTSRQKKISAYIKKGAKFSDWKKDPFLALMMYMQLQEAFGWQAFKKVFAEYRKLPSNQLPKNDGEKRDQWLIRFSKAVGKNLGPFFQTWGVPTSSRARQSISQLPKWMPNGFPPP